VRGTMATHAAVAWLLVPALLLLLLPCWLTF
jgi:hypothetical protein